MREVLVQFERMVVARDRSAYYARACGGTADDGTRHWHGWVEFIALHGGPIIRTPRETTQADRMNATRWARRLTPVYLEGALERGLRWGLTTDEEWYPTSRKSVRRKMESSPAGFARVGGMLDLKAQIRRIVETVHIRHADARRYGIVRNGILLYGPPGCGKTFFAHAMAEEFGLNFLPVPLESAISRYVGSAPILMEQLFQDARSRRPCLLFFDEFDAIARNRHDASCTGDQQMVDALLQQLDANRETRGLLIVAATNRFEDLDPAVIRDGRFDYKVQVDDPDYDARLAILRTVIGSRPHLPRLRLTQLAHDMQGFSAAQIRSVVDEAALAALESGQPIRNGHLHAAYRAHVKAGGYVENVDWDDIIVPQETKRKLQFIEQSIQNPGLIRDLGITPPSGILLFGPPGTGKTTIARVLASQSDASFFAVNAADIFSKWVGESERRVREIFARARARVPAIIFIDEIDATAPRRGESDSAGEAVRNAVVNMLLSEMDGFDSSTRVFVIGATNRPELLDEALLRPGRLGERIEIPLPDLEGRKKLLELFSKKMRLASSVDLERLAIRTDGRSGALLKGLCTLAGRHALLRTLDKRGVAPAAMAVPSITQDDFEQAFRELCPPTGRRTVGFHRPEENPLAKAG